MPQVIYITNTEQVLDCDVPQGMNLMRYAVDHAIGTIVGECGGAMSCGTCHVYIEADKGQQLDPPSEVESDLLNFAAAPRLPNSRLACQIVMSDELAGIRVCIPEQQL